MTDKQQPTRRFFQFNLRTLLVLVTLGGLGLGWFGIKLNEARRQREAVEKIREKIGQDHWKCIFYDYEARPFDDESKAKFGVTEQPGPDWLRNLLGIDFVSNIAYVNLSNLSISDKELPKLLDQFTKLEMLDLSTNQITDDGLRFVGTLEDLRYLNLMENWNISDDGLQHLSELHELDRLILGNTAITDDGLKHLVVNHPRLDYLSLNGTDVTEDGLRHLGQGNAHSHFCLTSSGESSLSPSCSPPRAIFSWSAATFGSTSAPKCLKEALGAAWEVKIRHPLPTRLHHTPQELHHFRLTCASSSLSNQIPPQAPLRATAPGIAVFNSSSCGLIASKPFTADVEISSSDFRRFVPPISEK